MKQCPQCNRSYEDDSLRFCLDDGALLRLVGSPARDPNATLVYGSPETWHNASPAEAFDQPITPIRASPRAYPNAPAAPIAGEGVHRGSTAPPTSRLLVGGVIAIAVLLLVGAVLAAAFLFRQSRQDQRDASGPNLANNDLKAPSPKQGDSTAKTSEKATSADGLNPKTSPLQIKVTASSVRYSVQSNTYDQANTIDGSQSTAWIEGVDGPGWGEWIRFDFDREINLHRILILPGYFKSKAIWASNNRISAAAFSFSDGTKRIINFPDRMERQKVDVGSIKTRWVRIELEDFYFGKDPDTSISEVAFEWEP